MADVVILGAGLTGLAAARYLEMYGFTDYMLFEKCSRPGGLVKSETVNGFTFDYTGHFLHLNNDEVRQFVDHNVGMESFKLHERRTTVFSHGTYIPYPFQAHLNGLPVSVITDCIEGFIKRKKNNASPATFYSWVLKYFGKGLAEHFFFPYNQKLFDYPAKKLHHSWTGRFVPQITLESLVQGACHPHVQRMGYNASFYYPRAGGIELLARNLSRSLCQPIALNAAAVSIDPIGKKIIFSSGKTEHYRTLISTMPLDQLLPMISPCATATLDTVARKLLCTTVLSVNLGLAAHVPDAHWTYFPEHQFPFYRVGFWHNVSQALVRPGHAALFAEIAFKRGSDVCIEERSATATAALAKQFGFSQSDIVMHKNLILDHAYVIYDRWRELHLDAILKRLRSMSIYSVGRYGAWKYASMQEAVLDGKDASSAVCGELGYRSAVFGGIVNAQERIRMVRDDVP